MKKPKKKRKCRPLFPCPKCGERSKVEDSIRKNGLDYPYRYRLCLAKACGHRFKTEEKVIVDK